MVKEIVPGFDRIALVDDDLYEDLIKYHWYCSKTGYVVAEKQKNKQKSRYYLHRVVLNAQKGQQIDHIDGNKLNNQRNNLRFCSYSENCQNRIRGRGASKYQGVARTRWKSTPWEARIKKDKKQIFLGNHKTEEEAALAYNKAAKELYGENARLNNVDGSAI